MKDNANDRFDFDEMLHPANAFGHPSEVVNDPDLTINEKRAILASWASDVCAVNAAPVLHARLRKPTVRFEDIMDALRTLDRQANGHRYHTSARRRRILARRRRNDNSGTGTLLQ
jgi:hypothetical protein